MIKANVIKIRDTFKNAGVKIQVFGDNSNVYDERYDVFIWDDEKELLYVIQRVKTQSVFEYSDPSNAAYYSILEYEIIQYIQAVSDMKQFKTVLPEFGNETEERRTKIINWVNEVATKRVNVKPGTDTKLDLAKKEPAKFDSIYGAGAAAKYLKENGVVIADVKINSTSVASLQNIVNTISPLQEIVLDSAVSLDEKLVIPDDKTVTLNLNGNECNISENNIIFVDGNLIIKDTTGTGTLKSDKSSINVYGDGKVIMDSGKIEVENDYGIYASDGGTVVINGGEITSLYSPLSGNNTTGDMNFEINGGKFTAKQGPVIYMPGQGKLTITNGEFNGGISVRMGQINISGGKFIATETIDDPKEYYFYSGNAWYPDALYVIGGTYKSDTSKYTNSLNLNITGGEFICQNGQGSAVAIYDFGKVAQKLNVKISRNAKLETNATDRHECDVLTLTDLGVTNPKPGFNNPAYVGKVILSK